MTTLHLQDFFSALYSRAKYPSRVSLTVCDTLTFLLYITLMCHLVSNYRACPGRKQITTLSDGLSTVLLNQWKVRQLK